MEVGAPALTPYYHTTREAVDAIRNMNKEGLAYWDNLYSRVAAEMEKEKKEGKEGKKGHH